MSLWMAIRPGPTGTRVLVTARGQETLLKARLLRDPAHPRALATLLEAVALWQGEQVRAVLAVANTGSGSDTRLAREAFALFEPTPLFHLDVVDGRRRRRHEEIVGMGDYRDLRQLLLFEVAR
jgi:hypothetical protein